MRQDTRMSAEIGQIAAPVGQSRQRASAPGAGVVDPGTRARLRRAADDRAARPRGRAARRRRPGRAVRLRQVDPAGAGLRAARAERRRRSRSAARARRAERLARCAYMPQRDLLLPWYSAIDNAALALRNRGLAQGGGAAAGRRAVRALRPRRLRADAAGRALRRHAPAGRLPPHPRLPASRCWPSTSRSPRSTRSPGPRCRSGWRRRCEPTRAPSSSSPTTSRRRSTSPTGWRCSRPGPARIVAELRAPAPRGAGSRRRRHRLRPSSPSARKRCGRCASHAGLADASAGSQPGPARLAAAALLLAADRRLADRRLDRRPRRRSSTSKTSSSPLPPKSPARSGRTARCWPKTPG